MQGRCRALLHPFAQPFAHLSAKVEKSAYIHFSRCGPVQVQDVHDGAYTVTATVTSR